MAEQAITEHVAYCPRHIGVGFPATHFAYKDGERLFKCIIIGCEYEFKESEGMEVDTR